MSDPRGNREFKGKLSEYSSTGDKGPKEPLKVLLPGKLKSLTIRFFKVFTGAEKLLLLLFVLMLVGGIAGLSFQNRGSGSTVPKVGGDMTEGLVGTPLRINPLLASANDVDTDLSRIVYAGVLKFDPNLNLVPDLAESFPEIKSDGKEYIIKLRTNLTWHDGQALTADDVVFTYQLIQNSDYQSPLRLSWNRVDVEKVDEYTVRLVTRESSATFITNLAVGILPKHIWENVTAESFALSHFNLEPIGSGPYQVSEIKRARGGEVRSIIFKPFDNYHAEGPFIKTLTFRFYHTTDELIEAYHGKEIAAVGYVPFDKSLFIEAKAKLQQYFLLLPQYQAVFINRVKNPAALEDVRVRMALARSTDKKKIIEEVFGKQAEEAYGPILPGHLGYHEQIPGAEMNIYDASKAKSLLEEAGWIMDPEIGFRKDKQGRIITLSLATNNFPPNVRVAEELKKMWEAIGIQVMLNIETAADLEGKFIRPRNYELLLFAENVGADPDPYPFWHSSQVRDPGVNFTNFSDRTADKLLVDARVNIPAEDRAAKYKQFQEIFVGDVPAIFITRSVYTYNIPTSVQGVTLGTVTTPSERFANINEWYIETKRAR